MTLIEKINLKLVNETLGSKRRLDAKEAIFLCEMLASDCEKVTQKQRDWIGILHRRVPNSNSKSKEAF